MAAGALFVPPPRPAPSCCRSGAGCPASGCSSAATEGFPERARDLPTGSRERLPLVRPSTSHRAPPAQCHVRTDATRPGLALHGLDSPDIDALIRLRLLRSAQRRDAHALQVAVRALLYWPCERSSTGVPGLMLSGALIGQLLCVPPTGSRRSGHKPSSTVMRFPTTRPCCPRMGCTGCGIIFDYGQDTIGGYLHWQGKLGTPLLNRNESPARTTSAVRWPACEFVEITMVVLPDAVGTLPKP